MTDDVLSEFESAITAAESHGRGNGSSAGNPWQHDGDGIRYMPNMDLLVELLTGPMAGRATTQSGRLAKAFDAWMSYELRRAQFDPHEVWPRNTTPRVSSRDIQAAMEKVDQLVEWVAARDASADAKAARLEQRGDADAVRAAQARLAKETTRLQRAHAKREKAHENKVAEARKKGVDEPAPLPGLELPTRVPVTDALLPKLRSHIQTVVKAMPNVNATNVLGRFYVKQVDVVVASWERGPDVLISGKTMFSSFAKNTKNRYEETLGEASNLRDRYPLAGMGYAFLVSNDILAEAGAYARLQDLLLRTRKPHGPYDATMLLIADWDKASSTLRLYDPLTHPEPQISGQRPSVDLSASRFYTDLINAVLLNTPVGVHNKVRVLRNGTPIPGGEPNLIADADADADADTDTGSDEDADAGGGAQSGSDVDTDAAPEDETDPGADPEADAVTDGRTH